MVSNWFEQLIALIKRRCSELLWRQNLGGEIIVEHIPEDFYPLLRLVILAELAAARGTLDFGSLTEPPHVTRFRSYYEEYPDWPPIADAFLEYFRSPEFREALKEMLALPGAGNPVAWMKEQAKFQDSLTRLTYAVAHIGVFNRVAELIDAFILYFPAMTHTFGTEEELQAEFESSETAAIALAERILANWLDLLEQESLIMWELTPALANEYNALFGAMKADLNG